LTRSAGISIDQSQDHSLDDFELGQAVVRGGRERVLDAREALEQLLQARPSGLRGCLPDRQGVGSCQRRLLPWIQFVLEQQIADSVEDRFCILFAAQIEPPARNRKQSSQHNCSSPVAFHLDRREVPSVEDGISRLPEESIKFLAHAELAEAVNTLLDERVEDLDVSSVTALRLKQLGESSDRGLDGGVANEVTSDEEPLLQQPRLLLQHRRVLDLG